jgi:hypothetical protein
MTGDPADKILKFRRLFSYVSTGLLLLVFVSEVFLIVSIVGQILDPYGSINMFSVGAAAALVLPVLLFYSSLFHYREKVVLRTSEIPNLFLDKDIDEFTSTRMLEKTGWEVKDEGEDYIEFEMENPSRLLRWMGEEIVLRTEIVENKNNSQRLLVEQNGEEREIDKTDYTASDNGTVITNTGVTRSKVSLLEVLVSLIQRPLLKDLYREVVEGDTEVLEMKLDLSIGKSFDLEDSEH